MKELKVLELFDRGYSYRQIAKEVKVSLRDVTIYVHRISNKTNSRSTTSVMDEVVLEYRVNGLRRDVKDLQMERDKLVNEVNNLRAQNYKLQIQVHAIRSELEVAKRDLEYEKFSNKILKEVFNKC